MKKLISFLIIISILIVPISTYANSGPTYWRGFPSSEILAIKEDSPISVENEDLIFDFTNEEAMANSSYSISSLVTAKYTMYNSSDHIQSVQMAFPFISLIERFNPEGIDIELDGEKVPYEIFIGDIVKSSGRQGEAEGQWDFEYIVKSISSSQYLPKNYKLDDIGSLYTYDTTPTSDEINIAIDISYDKGQSRIMTKGFNGYQNMEGTESIIAWIGQNQLLEIFVLGQDVDFNFNAYTDGDLTEETDEYSLDLKKEEISIGDYLARDIEVFENNIPYLDLLADNQISNQIIKSLDEVIENNVVYLEMEELFSLDYMERFYVLIYEVDFQPNARNEVGVTYISEGTMDRIKTSKPTHTFDYILNPAGKWESFENLNIEIKPPLDYPYIIDSSLDLERKEGGTYLASYESLPKEDLSFTLYHKEKLTFFDSFLGKLGINTYLFEGIAPIIIGFLIGFISRKIYKKVKKPKEDEGHDS